jgi:hypothetical protein
VNGDEKIIERFDREFSERIARFDFFRKSIQHFFDRISRHENPVALDAFIHQIFLAAFGVRQQNVLE